MQPHVDTPRSFAQDREAPSTTTPVASPRSAALVRAYAANDPTLQEDRGAVDADLDAYARHATASNGFGDAVVPAPTTSTQLHRVASHVRSRLIGEAIVDAVVAIAQGVRRAWGAYRQGRIARDTRLSLDELDDRMLHDLGLDRSETSSIGAEAAGRAERTRTQMMLASHGLYR